MKDSIFIAPGAVVRGDVTLSPHVNVWYNAVVRGDCADITVGEGSNVQDCAVLHVDEGCPLTVGRSVTIGHGAIVHGCTVGDEVLIGMGAVVLNGAQIGDGCIIGAGAVVTAGTVLPANTMALGCPAKAVRPVRPEERAATVQNARHYCALAEEAATAEQAAE